MPFKGTGEICCRTWLHEHGERGTVLLIVAAIAQQALGEAGAVKRITYRFFFNFKVFLLLCRQEF